MLGIAAVMALCTIKRSADFQRVRGGARWASPFFVIEARERATIGPTGQTIGPTGQLGQRTGQQSASTADKLTGQRKLTDELNCPRFGFTVTRKIGNAVVRNKLRRRFKEIARALGPTLAKPGFDYVVVARSAVVAQSFADMKQGFETALDKLSRSGPATESGAAGRSKRNRAPVDRKVTPATGPSSAPGHSTAHSTSPGSRPEAPAPGPAKGRNP